MRLIHSLRARRDDDEGFTLIELMVVVLIIAILISIAIPTFLGARKRAEDRAAQADLRNGLTTQKTYYTDGEIYADNSVAGSTALAQIEPLIGWNTKVTWNAGDVSVGALTVSKVPCACRKPSNRAPRSRCRRRRRPQRGTFYSPTPCPATIDGNAFIGWKTGGW